MNVGQACSIDQQGAALTFVNERGERSRGRFVDGTTVVATDWNLRGTLRNGGQRLEWSNGTWWERRATAATPPSAATVNIAGTWRHGAGGETWTFTPLGGDRYQAVEKGFANASGIATVTGDRVRIDFTWQNRQHHGYYEVTVGPDARTASGRWWDSTPAEGRASMTRISPPATPAAPATAAPTGRIWKLRGLEVDRPKPESFPQPPDYAASFTCAERSCESSLTFRNRTHLRLRYTWTEPPSTLTPGQLVPTTFRVEILGSREGPGGMRGYIDARLTGQGFAFMETPYCCLQLDNSQPVGAVAEKPNQKLKAPAAGRKGERFAYEVFVVTGLGQFVHRYTYEWVD